MTATLAEVLDLFKQVAQAQKDTDRLLREQSLESDIQPGETTTALNYRAQRRSIPTQKLLKLR